MLKKDAYAIIRKEIKWCREHKEKICFMNVSPEFRKGFMEGLKQARYLIGQLGKNCQK